jgi:phosphate starvation-inducible PhoH-like protein
MLLAAKAARIAPNKIFAHRCGKTPNQQQYIEHLRNPNVSMVVAVGSAGTGKTFLACQEAVQALRRGDVDRIVLTRPIVPVEGEDGLGFLPGSLETKMDPWTRPMLDIIGPMLLNDKKKKPQQQQVFDQVDMIPLAFMRGRTFDRTFVIADEMQNSTPNQMLMLVTRLGNHSRLVITGDPQQTDRSSKDNNGLHDLEMRILRSSSSSSSSSQIRLVHLRTEDVQRSALVTELLTQVYSPPASKATAAAAVAKRGETNDCALIIDDPYLRNK